jgi:hypothetical protein
MPRFQRFSLENYAALGDSPALPAEKTKARTVLAPVPSGLIQFEAGTYFLASAPAFGFMLALKALVSAAI